MVSEPVAKQKAKISVVIPAYNEEGNIRPVADHLSKVLAEYSSYEIIFVDDGSQDRTLTEIKQARTSNPAVKYVSLSRNFGHQNALKAGLDLASGDCVISIDADMQHPPELIRAIIAKWLEGFDIVYTIRIDDGLPFLKRATSKMFYRLINCLSDVEINEGAADFRLIDRKVADVFRRDIGEYYLFFRGLISWVGFKQYAIAYRPNKRMFGGSKYSWRRMISFALNGITSFSIKPLKISMAIGFLVSVLSFIYALYALYQHIFNGQTIAGWTSVIISVLFIGGIQMLLLGILGEYVGKLFFESKRRPHYIVRESDLS